MQVRIVSIHAFRGEGDSMSETHAMPCRTVSIHAFRGEGDSHALPPNQTDQLFQSTPSGGKATYVILDRRFTTMFQSTPSGGKATSTQHYVYYYNLFQSTPSGGKATYIESHTSRLSVWFQSTPSGGKATMESAEQGMTYDVSIHAFRGEGDQITGYTISRSWTVSSHAFRGEGDKKPACLFRRARRSFNPRLPGGRRHDDDAKTTPGAAVSIHAFRGEGD